MFTDDEVKQALEELPENFRMPVLLADVEDFSYKEIAEMMDIPIGTVMSRLHRGRKAMQKKLTDFATERGLISRSADAEEQTHSWVIATRPCGSWSSSSTTSCRTRPAR